MGMHCSSPLSAVQVPRGMQQKGQNLLHLLSRNVAVLQLFSSAYQKCQIGGLIDLTQVNTFFSTFSHSNSNFDPVVEHICDKNLLRRPIHHSKRLDVLFSQLSYFLGLD